MYINRDGAVAIGESLKSGNLTSANVTKEVLEESLNLLGDHELAPVVLKAIEDYRKEIERLINYQMITSHFINK